MQYIGLPVHVTITWDVYVPEEQLATNLYRISVIQLAFMLHNSPLYCNQQLVGQCTVTRYSSCDCKWGKYTLGLTLFYPKSLIACGYVQTSFIRSSLQSGKFSCSHNNHKTITITGNWKFCVTLQNMQLYMIPEIGISSKHSNSHIIHYLLVCQCLTFLDSQILEKAILYDQQILRTIAT